MLPLLDKSKPNDTNLTETKSKYVSKIFCGMALLIFLISISIISYFNFGARATNLHNNNPAKSLYNKAASPSQSISPNTATATTSDYYNPSGYDDEILTMPNLDPSSCSSSITDCEFKQYSGYLLANNNNEIHYWFIEADTSDDPLTKPLFFWTNGGPGCSGLDGLLTEHGPWRVHNNLAIEYNPYSWITEVNMVYLEQPFGVGFSVSDDDNIVAGDLEAAADMDAVIRNFLIKFPHYQDNTIYLSSESWGGHYVPMTTYTILQNNDADSTPYIHFGGFLLGNPYTDWYENTYGFVGGVYGHGLMMSADWDKWRSLCWDNSDNIDNDATCSAIYTRAYLASYNSNVYALDFPQCILDEDWGNIAITRSRYQKDAHLHEHAKRFMSNVLNHADYDALNMRMGKEELTAIYNTVSDQQTLLKADNTDSAAAASSYLPCIEYNMANWLNLAEVQTALNVKATQWEMCSDLVWDAWPAEDYDTFMQTYYDKIVSEYAASNNLKLCIYSGDDDSVCGLQGTQYWLDRWDGCEANEDIQWNAWEDDANQLGGYYTQYMDSNNNNIALHFITIRSAGHMVPTTQPQRALSLLKKYLYEFHTS